MPEINVDLENMLFRYWESLPDPKKWYSVWMYGDGGVRDMLLNYHKPEVEEKEEP
jgi:hypothetical protein